MGELSWESLLKFYGPLGLIVFALGMLIWKKLLPDLEKQQNLNRAMLEAALEEARKERNMERQLRERELERYMESMKYRDDQFKPVVEALNALKTRRER